MDLPKRKPNRLLDYGYNTPNAYFITICTKDRKNLFWTNVGAIIDRPQTVPLTEFGKIADRAISKIPINYCSVTVDRYVIMPNHIDYL